MENDQQAGIIPYGIKEHMISQNLEVLRAYQKLLSDSGHHLNDHQAAILLELSRMGEMNGKQLSEALPSLYGKWGTHPSDKLWRLEINGYVSCRMAHNKHNKKYYQVTDKAPLYSQVDAAITG